MGWCWIDRFIEFRSGAFAKAVKSISLAEEHLRDHFDGYPVMPHALILEGIAQTGGLLVCEYNDFSEKVILAKVPKAEFHFEAVPGDTLTYTVTLEDIQPGGARVSATSHRGEELQAELDIVFVHLPADHHSNNSFDPETFLRMARMLKLFEVRVPLGERCGSR